MLRTPVCDVFGIDVPIVQAAIAPYTTPELVAAISNAGGLGTIATAMRSPDDVRRMLARTRALTDRPFAVNFTLTTLSEESFMLALEARPKVISLALGDPGDYVRRAHEAGILLMHQVHTVAQARQAVGRGVDVLIAQGSEAGGFTGAVSTMALVPQVVDVAGDVPVLAAGGIAGGRGLAAALVLGAQGANIGTRFLASAESACADAWQRAILDAASEDAVKVDVWYDIFPAPGPHAYETSPRALRTAFVEEWNRRPDDARREAGRLQQEIMTGLQQGRLHELVPFTGQTAGAIHDVLPAAEIVRRIAAEVVSALSRAATLGQPVA